MHYAIMHRTEAGHNTKMRHIAKSIEDAEDIVSDSNPWLNELHWVRSNDSSTYELSDGSAWIIFREA